jgi:NADH-quinone oxidoreductase subunit L
MAIDEFSSWAVWLLPLIASLFVPVIAKRSEKARNYYVIVIAAGTAGLAMSLVPGVWLGNGAATNYSIPWISGINAGVYIDPLSVLFTCLVAFFALIIAVYSQGYMKGEEGLTRYYFLILLFIGSMIGLVISDNMLQMFIFWEMVGLCSYALISFWYKKPESIKSGVKVFIMTRIGDIALLAAIAILFYMFGTFSFHGVITGIQTAATAGTLDLALMVPVAFLVLGGAIAKSAQLPLFTWLYSAMEAPTSVSALLHAATMVKAGVYLLARFILIFSIAPSLIIALQPLWFPTVAWIGVLTAIVGASLALTTTDIKGVLAYSTVSQIGFMMAGLGAAATAAGYIGAGWFGSLFHMVSHAFFEGLGFLLAGGIIHAIGTRDMRLMGGLRKTMPITFILSVLMIITTSGLPPFAAFFSKGLIISSVTEVGNLIQIILLYTTTAITFAYSLRFLTLTFMGNESEHLVKQHVHEAPKIMLYPAMVLGGLCVVWGLLMPVVMSFMHVNLDVTLLGSVISSETLIFAAFLAPAGLIIYLTYYTKSQNMRTIINKPNPISTLLRHGYFFDDFYNKFVQGIIGFSEGLGKFETQISKFPHLIGPAFTRVGDWGKVLDTKMDQLLDSFAVKLVQVSSKLERGPSWQSLQNYVAAAVLGFILIVVLIILTIGMGV